MSIITDKIAKDKKTKLSGFKNLIINGNFLMWQRGTEFTENGLTCDRWRMANMEKVEKDVDENNNVIVKITPGGGDDPYFYTRIEDGVNITRGKKVTFSAYIKSDNEDPLQGFYLRQSSGGSSVIGKKKILHSQDGWHRWSFTVTIPNDWDDSANLMVDLEFTQNIEEIIYVKNVQLELGDEATEFENRPISLESLLCFRYTYKLEYTGSYDIFEGVKPSGSDYFYTTSRPFPVPMRSVPSVTTSHEKVPDNWGSTGTWDDFSIAPSKTSFSINFRKIDDNAVERNYMHLTSGTWILFDAEL